MTLFNINKRKNNDGTTTINSINITDYKTEEIRRVVLGNISEEDMKNLKMYDIHGRLIMEYDEWDNRTTHTYEYDEKGRICRSTYKSIFTDYRTLEMRIDYSSNTIFEESIENGVKTINSRPLKRREFSRIYADVL